MNIRLADFFKGMLVAAITGAVATGSTYMADPANITGIALGRRVGIAGGIGAAMGLAAWVKGLYTPVPQQPGTTVTTSTTKPPTP